MSLKAEIITRGYNSHKIAKLTGLRYDSVRTMVNGKTEFSLECAVKIIEIISDGSPEDKFYLFDKYFFATYARK